MIVDGKQLAQEILDQTKEMVAALGRTPRLAMLCIGGDPVRINAMSDSDTSNGMSPRAYLERKKRAARKVGIDSRIYEFKHDITTQKLRKEVVKITQATVNDGIIMELPFPDHINTQYVLNAMPQEKDPDVLSQKAQGAFFVGRSTILPPSVDTVKIICDKHHIDLRGKSIVVFGYGILIGKPIAHWLAQQGATVTVVNEHTKDQKTFSRDADIIVTGANKPHIVTADMVRKGALVIDFGYEKLNDKLVGNVVYDEVAPKASLITPVPGGVGPIGIASALRNALILIDNKSARK